MNHVSFQGTAGYLGAIGSGRALPSLSHKKLKGELTE